MKTLKGFDQVVEMLLKRNTPKKVAVVWPLDSTTRSAVGQALAEGFIEAIFVGCRAEVESDELISQHTDKFTVIDAEDPDKAAAKAVELARNGEADIIMKGMLNTDNLLRALLNKEVGILPPGNVLTHITVAQIPTYEKLLMFTDAAVIPYPTDAQRKAQLKAVIDLAHGMGLEEPRVALVHCSEKVDARHFPFTEDYVRLKEMSKEGEFGACIVDGPLDVKTSCSLAALQKKGLESPIQGSADALIFPDIEAANSFYKTLTLFGGASTAGILSGLKVPVVLPSRGDSVRSKFNSLAFASL